MVYKQKPKAGKGKRAWERYEAQYGKPPASVEYTDSYDHEFKGWICEWFGDKLDYETATDYAACRYHTFYSSSEL